MPTVADQPVRLLLVEDEAVNARMLIHCLTADGFVVDWRPDAIGVVDEIRRRPPDAVLLDIGLPGRDGLGLCQDIRAFSAVPVLFITAESAVAMRLKGLDGGADDYLCKPFDPDEVVARIRAVLRRSRPATSLITGGWRWDENTLTIHHGDLAAHCTKVEFRLFATLAAHPGRLFSRNDLLDAIHEDQRAVSDRTVDSHIKNLRRKLDDAGIGSASIKAVYGMGYRFEMSPA